jgi:hypothetical protein
MRKEMSVNKISRTPGTLGSRHPGDAEYACGFVTCFVEGQAASLPLSRERKKRYGVSKRKIDVRDSLDGELYAKGIR